MMELTLSNTSNGASVRSTFPRNPNERYLSCSSYLLSASSPLLRQQPCSLMSRPTATSSRPTRRRSASPKRHPAVPTLGRRGHPPQPGVSALIGGCRVQREPSGEGRVGLAAESVK